MLQNEEAMPATKRVQKAITSHENINLVKSSSRSTDTRSTIKAGSTAPSNRPLHYTPRYQTLDLGHQTLEISERDTTLFQSMFKAWARANKPKIKRYNMRESFFKRVTKKDFSARDTRKILDLVHDLDTQDSNRLANVKRENKIHKRDSDIVDRTTSLLLQEAAGTLSSKIIRLEDGPEGVIQHEDVMTEKERIMFFKERYNSGRLRSGATFRESKED